MQTLTLSQAKPELGLGGAAPPSLECLEQQPGWVLCWHLQAWDAVMESPSRIKQLLPSALQGGLKISCWRNGWMFNMLWRQWWCCWWKPSVHDCHNCITATTAALCRGWGTCWLIPSPGTRSSGLTVPLVLPLGGLRLAHWPTECAE